MSLNFKLFQFKNFYYESIIAIIDCSGIFSTVIES
jgi:hypothetical protein